MVAGRLSTTTTRTVLSCGRLGFNNTPRISCSLTASAGGKPSAIQAMTIPPQRRDASSSVATAYTSSPSSSSSPSSPSSLPSPSSHSPSVPGSGPPSKATRSSFPSESLPIRPLSFHVAGSYVGKSYHFDPSRHVYHFNPYHRPQDNANHKPAPLSRPESGHDAFFAARIGQSGAIAMGVADGVGGWVDQGVDPGDFSHALCRHMADAATNQQDMTRGGGEEGQTVKRHSARDAVSPSTPPGIVSAKQILERGYTATCHDPSLNAGGSTACVAVASPETGTLDVANLGDSGFLVLRSSAVINFSIPQTHDFNTPFQLSLVPPEVTMRLAAFGGQHHIDMPSDAEAYPHLALRRGDVVVLATDGVWDNLFNQDILRVVSGVMMRWGGWYETRDGVGVSDELERSLKGGRGDEVSASRGTLQGALAIEIAAAAKAASLNRKVNGPFAKAIKKYFPNEAWSGGKVDDICVMVMVVGETKGPQKIRARL